MLTLIVLATLSASFSGAGAARLAGETGQEKEAENPFANDPGAIGQGRSVFRLECARCHGIDARGASRGPDLTSGRWTHGESDPAIFNTISRGVPGTEMPASSLIADEIWMIVAFLRSLGAGPAGPVAGDRQAGEEIFFGTGICAQCHMVKGKGGRLGPDLSRFGASRPARYLAEAIRNPSEEISAGYETVVVATRDGQRITGVRKNEDSFSIQLMDEKEQLHLLLKKDLDQVIYEQKSLMPEYTDQNLDEKELRDLLAYLDSLRGQ